MIVTLRTTWDVCPTSWAVANGRDADRCARELMWYLSAVIGDLPMFSENEAIVARDGVSGVLPYQLDGRARFRLGWSIDTTAEAWWKVRAEVEPYTDFPVQRRAARDIALNTAAELYGSAEVVDADAVLQVEAPYAWTFTPESRRRAGDGPQPAIYIR